MFLEHKLRKQVKHVRTVGSASKCVHENGVFNSLYNGNVEADSATLNSGHENGVFNSPDTRPKMCMSFSILGL